MRKIDADALLEKVKKQEWENGESIEELINSCETEPNDPQVWDYTPFDGARLFISNVTDANKAQEFIQYIDVFLRHNAS